MDLEKIKQQRDCWIHSDNIFDCHWYDYIKIDMVEYLISENERLQKEIVKVRTGRNLSDGIIKLRNKEIERLKKEREWLLDHMVYDKEDRQWVENRMQQALKER